MAVMWAACLWLAAAISGCERSAQFADIDGAAIDPGGRILLINYWAEWCKPCREEIPELNQFAREQAQRVLVLGVHYDQLPAEQIREQMAGLGIEFPVLASDPAALWDQPRPQVLPSTLVIDGSGRWRATLVGPQTEESLRLAVRELSE
jgi:thiol-disulfide isomerase/thioredoxin